MVRHPIPEDQDSFGFWTVGWTGTTRSAAPTAELSTHGSTPTGSPSLTPVLRRQPSATAASCDSAVSARAPQRVSSGRALCEQMTHGRPVRRDSGWHARRGQPRRAPRPTVPDRRDDGEAAG